MLDFKASALSSNHHFLIDTSVHTLFVIDNSYSELNFVLVLLDILLAGSFVVLSIVKAIELVRIDENSTEDALGLISLFFDEVLKRDFLDTWDLWAALSLGHCLVIHTMRCP